MDCDEQHEPCRIPLFVRECLQDDADIISGSRYLLSAANGSVPPADRRNINRIITDLVNSVLHLNVLPPKLSTPNSELGNADLRTQNSELRTQNSELRTENSELRLTDSFCGFKAHRVSSLQRMNLTISGYAFPMQFWVQAAALGLAIRELPVKLIYKDATRHFGGTLDDPMARLQHYLEVLSAEARAVREPAEAAACLGPACEYE